MSLPPADEVGRRAGSARWPLGFAALLVCTALLCFYDLDGGAGFEPIDCWVAQTALEMREGGTWQSLLIPVFSGEVRMQKSPGPYWAVILASWIRNDATITEATARTPGAIAALVLVVTIYWLTRRIAGQRPALFAGFAASASALVLWWSHRAASDLGLAACTTLSLAALWVASECEKPGTRRGLLWLLGYCAAGVGMLYKMPMPLVVVGLPAVCYVLLRRRWKVLLSPWHLLGLVVFLLPWLPWAIAAARYEDAALAKWTVEYVDRFRGTLPNVKGQSGWRYLFTYLAPTILYCLPFSLSLPGAIARGFRSAAGVCREGSIFMLVWYASLLVFFTASTGKEERYFLPALPPLFVLLGIELAAFFDPGRSLNRRLVAAGAAIVWIVIPALLFAGGWHGLRTWWRLRGQFELEGLHTLPEVWTAYAVTAGILAAGFAVAAALYLFERRRTAFGAIVVTVWASWIWGWPTLAPMLMSQRPFKDFAAQLVERVPADLRPSLRQVGTQDSRIIWYSGLRFPRVIDQLDLLAEQRARVASGRQRELRDLRYEIRRYGETMVRLLERDEPVLFVASFPDFYAFRIATPKLLGEAGREMPPCHLWLQTRYGTPDRHFVLFGNRPPPFDEPDLVIAPAFEERLQRAAAKLLDALGPDAGP